MQSKYRRLRWWSVATVVLVYLVILAGGVVRTTGSGMGCPDWPKCFGGLVPPTHESQLPENYLDFYLEKRMQKVERLAKLLQIFGANEIATKLLNDPSIRQENPFNVVQTWIEYINRLLGALVGLFLLITVRYALPLWKEDRGLTYWSAGALGLTIVLGLTGFAVVVTNLLPGMVTIHMLLALIVAAMMIYVVARSYKGAFQEEAIAGLSKLNWILAASALLYLGQIALGTQVRESIDTIAQSMQMQQRELWIGQLGASFLIHRSYSLLLLGMHVYLWWLIKKASEQHQGLRQWAWWLCAAIVLEIATGAGMAYLAIPSVLQPTHLLLASIIFGMQIALLIRLNYSTLYSKGHDLEYK